MALELSHRRYGAGPPVVILHGLFGCARNWEGIAASLAASHCVYTLDLRNHGESPWDATMSYPEMAADVRHTLARLGLQAPALVGHSMGGKVAMRLALEEPAQVAALVVVDIAPVAYPQELDWVPRLAGIDLGALRETLSRRYPLGGPVPARVLRGLLPAPLPEMDEHFDWRVNLGAVLGSLRALSDFPAPEGAAYPGPALFVAGARSPYVKADHGPVIERLFPRAAVVEIAHAGHWVHADQPAQLSRRITEFLVAARR